MLSYQNNPHILHFSRLKGSPTHYVPQSKEPRLAGHDYHLEHIINIHINNIANKRHNQLIPLPDIILMSDEQVANCLNYISEYKNDASFKSLDADSKKRISVMDVALRLSIGEDIADCAISPDEFLSSVESVKNYSNIDGSPFRFNVFDFVASARKHQITLSEADDFFSQLADVLMKDRQAVFSLQSMMLQHLGSLRDACGRT